MGRFWRSKSKAAVEVAQTPRRPVNKLSKPRTASSANLLDAASAGGPMQTLYGNGPPVDAKAPAAREDTQNAPQAAEPVHYDTDVPQERQARPKQRRRLSLFSSKSAKSERLPTLPDSSFVLYVDEQMDNQPCRRYSRQGSTSREALGDYQNPNNEQTSHPAHLSRRDSYMSNANDQTPHALSTDHPIQVSKQHAESQQQDSTGEDVQSPRWEFRPPAPHSHPIRRRSLLTPGIVTRRSSVDQENISRRASVGPCDSPHITEPPAMPQPVSAHTTTSISADLHDYDHDQAEATESPLDQSAQISTVEIGPRTVTPSELDYQQTGMYKLGTLRITNGAASPTLTIATLCKLDNEMKCSEPATLQGHTGEESDEEEMCHRRRFDTDSGMFVKYRQSWASLKLYDDGAVETVPSFVGIFTEEPVDFADDFARDCERSLAELCSSGVPREGTESSSADKEGMTLDISEAAGSVHAKLDSTSPSTATDMAESYQAEIMTSPFSFEASGPPTPEFLATSKHTALEDHLFDDDESRMSVAIESVIIPERVNGRDSNRINNLRKHTADVAAFPESQAVRNKPLTKVDSGYSSSTASLRATKSSPSIQREVSPGLEVADAIPPPALPKIASSKSSSDLQVRPKLNTKFSWTKDEEIAHVPAKKPDAREVYMARVRSMSNGDKSPAGSGTPSPAADSIKVYSRASYDWNGRPAITPQSVWTETTVKTSTPAGNSSTAVDIYMMRVQNMQKQLEQAFKPAAPDAPPVPKITAKQRKRSEFRRPPSAHLRMQRPILEATKSLPVMPKQAHSQAPLPELPDTAVSVDGRKRLNKPRPATAMEVTVQRIRDITPTTTLPPVSPEAFAHLEDRVNGFPPLEHTYKTVHKTDSKDTLATIKATTVEIDSHQDEQNQHGFQASNNNDIAAPPPTTPGSVTIARIQESDRRYFTPPPDRRSMVITMPVRPSLLHGDPRRKLSFRSKIGKEEKEACTEDRKSWLDEKNKVSFEAHITSFGTVSHSLGASPYDSAMRAMDTPLPKARFSVKGRSERSVTAPHSIGRSSQEEIRSSGMSAVAAALFARERSEQRKREPRQPQFEQAIVPSSTYDVQDGSGVRGRSRSPQDNIYVPPLPELPSNSVRLPIAEMLPSWLPRKTRSPPPVSMATRPILSNVSTNQSVSARHSMQNQSGDMESAWSAQKRQWAQRRESADASLQQTFNASLMSYSMHHHSQQLSQAAHPRTSNALVPYHDRPLSYVAISSEGERLYELPTTEERQYRALPPQQAASMVESGVRIVVVGGQRVLLNARNVSKRESMRYDQGPSWERTKRGASEWHDENNDDALQRRGAMQSGARSHSRSCKSTPNLYDGSEWDQTPKMESSWFESNVTAARSIQV